VLPQASLLLCYILGGVKMISRFYLALAIVLKYDGNISSSQNVVVIQQRAVVP
jgi:hypothetical protein